MRPGSRRNYLIHEWNGHYSIEGLLSYILGLTIHCRMDWAQEALLRIVLRRSNFSNQNVSKQARVRVVLVESCSASLFRYRAPRAVARFACRFALAQPLVSDWAALCTVAVICRRLNALSRICALDAADARSHMCTVFLQLRSFPLPSIHHKAALCIPWASQCLVDVVSSTFPSIL